MGSTFRIVDHNLAIETIRTIIALFENLENVNVILGIDCCFVEILLLTFL